VRAKRLLAFARAWLERPPGRGRGYVRRDYPRRGADADGGGQGQVENGWAVAHLPGVGPYALDSWRIFGMDALLAYGGRSSSEELSSEGLSSEGRHGGGGDDDGNYDRSKGRAEEWTRVVPGDKDLRAWLVWRWRKEGMEYDVLTGRRRQVLAEEEERKEVEEDGGEIRKRLD